MKSIKEKAEEYVDDYYQKLGISKDEYPTDVVISKADFVEGANYVLDTLWKELPSEDNRNLNDYGKALVWRLKECIEQLKE